MLIKKEFKQILQMIDRPDIAEELKNKFDHKEQERMYELMKDIMADEITFVMAVQEMNKSKSKNSLLLN